MYTLLPIHSFIRWLVVIVAVIAALKFAVGWLRGDEFKGIDRALAAGFSGLLDLQATLGIIMLVGFALNGEGFPTIRLEHAGTMFFVLVLAHLPLRWRKAEASVRFRNTLLCILGALVLIYFGVSILPVGWGSSG